MKALRFTRERSTVRTLLKRLFALFWITFVILVVAGAIALTSVRVILANAEGYREEVVGWIGRQLQQPVTVSGLDARMQGLQPTLLLENVRLLDSRGEPTSLQFRELRVGIDLWRSLLRQRVTLGLLTVVGAEISVRRDRQGKLQVEGLALKLDRPVNTAAPADTGGAGEWLLSQSHLLIRDSIIRWQDEGRDEPPMRFEIARIELRNQGRRHQLDGVVMLPEGVGRTIRVAADFSGSGNAVHDWGGSFYLNGLGIRLGPLLEMFRPKRITSGVGQLDLELWGRWEGGRLTHLRGEAGVRDLVLRAEKERIFRLGLLNGVLQWRRDEAGWTLDVPRLRVNREGEAWPDSHLKLVVREEEGSPRYDLRSSFLRIGDLADLALFVEPSSGEWGEAVAAMRPRGDLSDLHVEYRPQAPLAQRLVVSARMRGLALQAWKKLPALQGVSGILWADGESGALRLESEKGSIDFPRLARNPWHFGRLKGLLEWQKDGGGWYLSGRELELSNPDLKAKGELDLVVPGGGVPPFLDLRIAFKEGRVVRAPSYYPTAILRKKLLDWLDRSLLAGEVTAGSLVLHGRLKKGLFPYRKGEGVFEVGFNARGVRLEYLKGWPRIDSLNADVLFRGAGLRIDARKGRIMGVRIDGSHVRIDDYHDRMLTVLGEARGDGGQMLRFLREAPIAAEAEPALARMSVAGQATLGLYLGIPLHKQPVEYRGTVTLHENSLRYRLGEGYLEATNIDGRVQFDREGYRANSLDAFLFDRPASIEVATSRGEEGETTTRIAIDGRLLPAALARQLRVPLLERLDGESALQAELKFNYHRLRPGPLLELRVDSTLEGITSTLPAPLGKPDEVAAPLHIDWDDASQRVRFLYGEVLKGDIALGSSDEGSPPGAGYLHFGPGEGRLPAGPVLRITGALEGIAPGEWRGLWADFPRFSAGSKGYLHGLRVDLELERLQLEPSRNGSVTAGEKGFGTLDPRLLPALTVGVHELRYRELNLGRLAFRTRTGPEGALVEQLVLDAPYMKLQGRGEWLAEGKQRTVAKLVLTAPQTHTMLEALGLAAMIHGENLHIEGELEWSGSPMDFSLQGLQGDLNLAIGSGWIESVEPGAGRLFGLFSLQALPRRLTLDFRDLFGKGFRFDSIKGEIRLEDGNAITRNLLLEGPTARIAVSGRTGYVARDYDQHILVIPGDGSNLFVAGALAWGPQAGALIWMAEKLLRLDKVAQYVYHVTGSWENPVITRGREKAASAPPGGE